MQYQIDTQTCLGFIQSLGQLIIGSVALDSGAFKAMAADPNAPWLAFAVLFTAGFSMALGHSVVLLVNRVKPWRFAATICYAATGEVLQIPAWFALAWFLRSYVFGYGSTNLTGVLMAICLGYAPMVFGFFIATPWFGFSVSLLLRLWMLLAVIVAVNATDMKLWHAWLCVGLAWLIVRTFELASETRYLPIKPYLRRLIAGMDRELSGHALMLQLVNDLKQDALRGGRVQQHRIQAARRQQEEAEA